MGILAVRDSKERYSYLFAHCLRCKHLEVISTQDLLRLILFSSLLQLSRSCNVLWRCDRSSGGKF